jgi:hypothetical protein
VQAFRHLRHSEAGDYLFVFGGLMDKTDDK